MAPEDSGIEFKRLEDVCLSISDGDWIESKDQSPEGYRLLQIGNIGISQFRESGKPKYVSEETFNRLRCTKIEIGDVLIARMPHPTGRSWCVDTEIPPSITSVDVAIVRVEPSKLSAKYLSYFLNCPSTLARNAEMQTGSTRQRIKRSDLADMSVPLPPLGTQTAIAKVLHNLDAKIKSNLETSKTLEHIAQTIFKFWFIDFGPVKAKMSGEMPVGMDEATSALFPDSMDDSELGPIPKGWVIKSFREIASISKSSIYPQKYPEDEFRHYSIPDFDKQQYPSFSSGFEILSGKFLLTKSTVLLSKLNPETTRIWTVLNPAKSSVCSTEFIVLVPKDETLLPFIHALTRHRNFYERFVSLATGSTGSRQRVRPEEILSIGFIASGSDLLERFSQLVRPFIEQQDVLSEEIQTLVKLRNLLLPRLISGELKIPEKMLITS